jgi:hypothetical protein
VLPHITETPKFLEASGYTIKNKKSVLVLLHITAINAEVSSGQSNPPKS